MKGDYTMGFKSDIEIAQEVQMQPITEVAAKAGIDPKYLEQYGNYKAKIDYNLLRETDAEDGKLTNESTGCSDSLLAAHPYSSLYTYKPNRFYIREANDFRNYSELAFCVRWRTI